MSPGPLLYIEYWDHGSSCGWLDNDDVDLVNIGPNKLMAVGWLLGEDETVIILGSFLNENSSHVRQYIIKGAITKRRRMKVPK